MMTPEQVEKFRTTLEAAMRLRILAAETYLRAVEFAVPLVDGDMAHVRQARECHGWTSRFCNSTLAALVDGDAESIRLTFAKKE